MSTNPINIEEARRQGIPLPQVRPAGQPMAKAKKPVKQRTKPQRTSPEKYTIAQAFDYFYGISDGRWEQFDALNDERALRAVAFLLSYCTQHGNKLLDGNAANGLARIVEYCAERPSR